MKLIMVAKKMKSASSLAKAIRQILFFCLIISITACSPGTPASPVLAASPSPSLAVPTDSPIPPVTSAASAVTPTEEIFSLPSETSLPEETEAVHSVTATAPGCLRLLRPADGALIPEGMRIDLAWDAQPGASSYVVLLVHPNGKADKLPSNSPSLALNIAAGPKPAPSKWTVLPYDEKGYLICSPTTYSFTILPAQKKVGTAQVASEAIIAVQGTPLPTYAPTTMTVEDKSSVSTNQAEKELIRCLVGPAGERPKR